LGCIGYIQVPNRDFLNQPSVGFGLCQNCWLEFFEPDYEILVVVSVKKKVPVRCVVRLCVRDNEQELALID
jgi:hypothetical protein